MVTGKADVAGSGDFRASPPAPTCTGTPAAKPGGRASFARRAEQKGIASP